MARLSQLAGNLWIVFPPTVTIAVLFALFQQGLSLFNFTTQFFYLSPQMFYFPFIFSARASAERRKASVSSTRLSCWSF